MSENFQKLGELFRMERERQGLSVDEIATTLRVAPSKLTKMEAGDTSDFPSALYFKLFCKSYAEALGIDYTRTLDAINESLGLPSETVQNIVPKPTPAEGEPKFPELGFTPSRRKASPVGWSLGVIVVVIIVAVTLLKMLEPDNIAQALNTEEQANEYNDTDTLNIPPVNIAVIATAPTFAVIAEGKDTVLARKLAPGDTYHYSGRQRVQISIAMASAVRTMVNGWEVDFSDHETGLISALVIDPVNLPSYLRQPAPPSPSPEVPQATYQTEHDNSAKQPAKSAGH